MKGCVPLKGGVVLLYKSPNHEAREAFHQGLSRHAYQMLGARLVKQAEGDVWHFAVWAPNARAVNLTGEFCGWDVHACPMAKQYDGIWELRAGQPLYPAHDPERFSYPTRRRTALYKYAVFAQDGSMAEG